MGAACMAALLSAVAGPVVAGGARPARARSAGGGPFVSTMVVGAGGRVLVGPRWLWASPGSVSIGRRSCAVAAGTPLAVLVALRHAGGPGFALRDYGHCGSSAVASGQLFVYSLGGETNRGADGWEYKVNSVSGTTGAADASGPFGNGRRLSSGQQVLWFWCQAHAGGCQRTLGVYGPGSVSRGQTATVSVYGYDNYGRGIAVAGALVTLGSSSAVTGSDGKAVLRMPLRPGRYPLNATRRGMVPAFPGTVGVR